MDTERTRSSQHRSTPRKPTNINGRHVSTSKKAPRKKLTSFSKKRTTITTAYVSIIVFLGILVFLITNKNAFAVYLGSEHIGNIKKNKKISSTYIQELAVKKLETELKAKVSVYEQITLKEVHSNKKDINNEDAIVSSIYKKFTYKIEGIAIVVTDIEMAVVQNEEALNQLYDKIISKYVKDTSTIVEKSFLETTTKPKFVPSGEILTIDKAYDVLMATTQTPQTYTIKKNDYLDGIASSAGMTREEIIKANKGLSVDSVLKIGQQLNILVKKPVLSVKTVEQIKYKEVAKKETEIKENPSKYKTYRNVIQIGNDGENEITENITKINGLEKERFIVSNVPTIIATPDIIEIGTSLTR